MHQASVPLAQLGPRLAARLHVVRALHSTDVDHSERASQPQLVHRGLRGRRLQGGASEDRRAAEAAAILLRVVLEERPVGGRQLEVGVVLLGVERDDAVNAKLREKTHPRGSVRAATGREVSVGGPMSVGLSRRVLLWRGERNRPAT